MMRPLVAVAIPLLIALSSCSRSADTRQTLAVSIPAQKWLLDSIAGDRFNVVALLSDGSNPETFEPAMKQMIDLENSSAYFAVGGLPFEQSMLPKIQENFPNLPVFSTDTYVQRLEDSHAHSHPSGQEGHHHHDGDPHIWSSFTNASAMARAMYERLIALDPAGKDYYTARYDDLRNNLAALDDSVASALRPFKGRSIVVWHPSLSYFAHDYGLNQISVENEGKEASAAQYRRQLDLAGAQNPVVFFLQREFDSRQGASMAAELNLRTSEISVMQADIPAQIRQITHDITSNN